MREILLQIGFKSHGQIWAHVVNRVSCLSIKISVAAFGAPALSCRQVSNLANYHGCFASVVGFTGNGQASETVVYLSGLSLWTANQ